MGITKPELLVRNREADFELRDNGGGDEGAMPILSGYMVRFNEWTEINSRFEGHFMERIAPGAAKKTLRDDAARKKGAKIKVLFDHGMDPSIGDKPLIDPTIVEDSAGVRYEGQLFDTEYCRELVPALEAGVLGSSFQFRVIREEREEEPEPSDFNPKGLPQREVIEFELPEGGPVVFPAYEGATAGARAGERPLETLVRRAIDRDREAVQALLDEESETEERTAIGYKKTSTSDSSWDVGVNEKRLPSPMPVATMREAYAWMDTSMMEGGMCPKSAGKFIHHEVSVDGAPGAANMAACSNGIGVLNGGRGGADIPDSDRQGVYNHLSKHLKDGGKEPPPLRSIEEIEAEQRDEESTSAEQSATTSTETPTSQRRAPTGVHPERRRAIDTPIGQKPKRRPLEESVGRKE